MAYRNALSVLLSFFLHSVSSCWGYGHLVWCMTVSLPVIWVLVWDRVGLSGEEGKVRGKLRHQAVDDSPDRAESSRCMWISNLVNCSWVCFIVSGAQPLWILWICYIDLLYWLQVWHKVVKDNFWESYPQTDQPLVQEGPSWLSMSYFGTLEISAGFNLGPGVNHYPRSCYLGPPIKATSYLDWELLLHLLWYKSFAFLTLPWAYKRVAPGNSGMILIYIFMSTVGYLEW